MADTKGGSRRDFGGQGTKDWFQRRSPKGGESKSAAKKRAQEWRNKGHAVVIDMLGSKKEGKGYGVYSRKSKRKKAKPKKKAAKKKK
jgi:hypothetical protein